MIRILAPEVVNRIAAGEVVERPASVVKELVENALDAGAGEIVVEFSGGGVERIEVADDGAGMSPDEAILALERHATSKIETERDLLGVRSYGFRGEALPSIASVSRLTLLSKPAGAQAGTRVLVEGGEVRECSPAGLPPGTRVRVQDLFFNTPARLKFLKTERTETAHVTDVVRHLALTRPDVAISLHHDGVEVFSCPAGQDLAVRARSLMGRLTLHEIVHDAGEVSLRALLTAPEQCRVSTAGLVLVVNGRVVLDRSLSGAIAAGHEGLLPAGRYPQGVVMVKVPATGVDVNVHPQKREVRFASPRTVTSALFGAVSGWARQAPWTRGVPVAMDLEAAGAAARRPGLDPEQGLLAASWSEGAGTDRVRDGDPRDDQTLSGLTVTSRPTRASRFSSLRVLGQALGTYLVCQDDDALVLVDQHAAAERVTYERLRSQLRAGGVQRQLLLVPVRCDVQEEQAALVLENEGLLSGLGLCADLTGPGSVTVREVPALLGGVSPERLLGDVLDRLEAPWGRVVSLTEDVLATMACHASLRGGDAIDGPGARALLESLDTVDWANHCPHGRPVSLVLPRAEIERRFGRSG